VRIWLRRLANSIVGRTGKPDHFDTATRMATDADFTISSEVESQPGQDAPPSPSQIDEVTHVLSDQSRNFGDETLPRDVPASRVRRPDRSWHVCAPILAALLFGGSPTAPASADAINNRFDKTAVAGVPMFIGHFAHVDPDCSSSGRTFVRVSRGPTHGVVTTQERFGFSNFPRLPGCNSHKVKGVTVWYRPEKGFTGYDAVELDIIFPSVNEHIDYYNITIK
jgi:hypothetical protein